MSTNKAKPSDLNSDLPRERPDQAVMTMLGHAFVPGSAGNPEAPTLMSMPPRQVNGIHRQTTTRAGLAR